MLSIPSRSTVVHLFLIVYIMPHYKNGGLCLNLSTWNRLAIFKIA